ncbi:hypothetical protein ACFYXS_39340 [Streptomyces sp. NPDC002574]|uniref:hypothetical protein n=1 Tax=Streptomyces sp. NPDC002574 TaxID=3364652 RepID=UPI0036AFC115
MSGIRSASIAAALLGCTLLLSGCTDSSGSGSDSAAGTSTSPSPEASAPAGASTEASPSASSSATTPAPSHSATASAKATATAQTPSKAPTKAPQAPVSVPGCRNLSVSSAVKSAVTRAYTRSYPRFVHIAPAPQRFFYGQCGTVRYAATPFDPASGAKEGELVGLQDEGGAMKYFRSASGTDWTYLTSDGFPAGPHGCADIPQIPRALATAWRNCAVG